MAETWNVTCCACRKVIRNDQAHVVKANTLSGRAWRCDPCGDAALAEIRGFNRCIREQSYRSGTGHSDG